MLGVYDLLATWAGYSLTIDIAGCIIRRDIGGVNLPLDIDICACGRGLIGVAVIFTLSHNSGLLAVLY
jgi:hypothetical protein